MKATADLTFTWDAKRRLLRIDETQVVGVADRHQLGQVILRQFNAADIPSVMAFTADRLPNFYDDFTLSGTSVQQWLQTRRPACPWTTPDECRMARERGASTDTCTVHPETAVLIGLDEQGGEEWRSRLPEFLDANRDGFDTDDVARVQALAVGEEITFGGGAAALSRVRRIA